MSKIDKFPCHPRNKLQLSHRFVLPTIAWHFTIADIGKTWVTENIDNIVSQYIRQLLELPISATLSSLILSKSKYGVNLILPSTKFLLCQVVVRNAVKSSPNSDIKALWSSSISVATFRMTNTKQVLNAIQNDNEDRLRNALESQGFILTSIYLPFQLHHQVPK